MYEQQYVRIPNTKGAKIYGLSRSKVYELAQKYPRIFRRLDGCTMVDLKVLNDVIAKSLTGRKARAAA
jgi:hypothetical protein